MKVYFYVYIYIYWEKLPEENAVLKLKKSLSHILDVMWALCIPIPCKQIAYLKKYLTH